MRLNAGVLRRVLPGFLFFLIVSIAGQIAYDRRQRALDARAMAQVQATLARQALTLLSQTRLGIETIAVYPGVLSAGDPAVRRAFANVFQMLQPLGIETLSVVRIEEKGGRAEALLTMMAPEVRKPVDISAFDNVKEFRKAPRFMASRMFKPVEKDVAHGIVILAPAGNGVAIDALLNVDRLARRLAATQPQIAGRLSLVVDGTALPAFAPPAAGDAGSAAPASEVRMGSSIWRISILRPAARPWGSVLTLQLLLALLLGGLSAWARTLVKQRRFARENFEMLVTRMRSAVLTTDEQGTIHYSNPFSDGLFAGGGRSLRGLNVFDSIIPERDRDGARTRLRVKDLFEKMKDEASEVNVNENISLDGRSRWIAWTGSKFQDPQGRPLFISVGNDVTAQKDAERLLAKEKERSDQLLRAILPDEKVEELKRTGAVAPMTYDPVAVFFTDVVDFTRFSDTHGAEEVVRSLQEMVSAFERICDEHGIEKIKTVGDAFMGVGGLLSPLENPALTATRCALDLVAASRKFQSGWRIRAGVHVGPVQAGVIGASKFLFDVFGDTVNVAARMESNGVPGSVTVSAAVWSKIETRCAGRKRGDVEIKGKGTMEMYVVEGLSGG